MAQQAAAAGPAAAGALPPHALRAAALAEALLKARRDLAPLYEQVADEARRRQERWRNERERVGGVCA